MRASRSCCRFVGCTSMMCPVPPHPKGALLDWDLMTVEAIWVKWTHCHVQETSLRWFELCDMVHYTAGSSIRRWVHCSHKRMDMVSNNTLVGCVFKRCSIGTKRPKVCQENIPHPFTLPRPAWTVETRQDGSMLSCSLCQILTIRPGNIFTIFYCPILVILCEL